MSCCSPLKAENIGRVYWPNQLALNFGGQQIMPMIAGDIQVGRPVWASNGQSGDYFQIRSNGTNWVAERYIADVLSSTQVGPIHTLEPIGTFGALTVYVP